MQFTAPDRERQIANRELGTIERIDRRGHLQIRLDAGRTVAMTLKDHPHLDYGYAVTSHSSQGQTADRVLVHIDTDRAGEQLVNRRLAYVAVSRGRYDAQIYTNDTAHLAQALSRDVGHQSAMERSLTPAAPSESLKTSRSRSGGSTDDHPGALALDVDAGHRSSIRARCSTASRVPSLRSAAWPPLTPPARRSGLPLAMAGGIRP